MTDNKAPRKRRSVSKARMYKELDALLNEYGLGNSSTVEELLNALRTAIVKDAIG